MKTQIKSHTTQAAGQATPWMFWRRSEKAFDALISKALRKSVTGSKPSPQTWNIIRQKLQNS